MGVWEFIFPTSHTALKICSIMLYWETSTWVHTTFTFKKTIFSEVNRDSLNFTCGNSSKDTKWKLQISFFILRFWDSVSHSSSAAPLFEQTSLVNQRTLKFTCSVCVSGKNPLTSFYACCQFQLYLCSVATRFESQVPHLQMTLWVRASIFCHSPNASQEDHLEPSRQRLEQRLGTSQFVLTLCT